MPTRGIDIGTKTEIQKLVLDLADQGMAVTFISSEVEPTRGIDIGTKTEIQKLVLDLADQGMAVTFISSEVEEMLRTCSRMAVLRDGEKVGELNEQELSQGNIMKAIAGGDDK